VEVKIYEEILKSIQIFLNNNIGVVIFLVGFLAIYLLYKTKKPIAGPYTVRCRAGQFFIARKAIFWSSFALYRMVRGFALAGFRRTR